MRRPSEEAVRRTSHGHGTYSLNLPRSAQGDRMPFDSSVASHLLGDLHRLILADAGYALTCIAAGPPDLELDNPRRLAQANVLFQWRGTKGSSTPDGPIDRAGVPSFVFNRQFDSRTNRRAVGSHSHQPQADPIVSVAGILEQPEWMTVSRRRAARFRHDFLVAVIVQIGEGHAVSFVKLAGTRRGGDVDEEFPLSVAKEHIGDE